MIISIPDSFVWKDIKSSQTSGAGEAKLYIGSKNEELVHDAYFNNFTNITCTFDKANLIAHIDRMIAEIPNFIRTRQERVLLETYYGNLKNEINPLTNFSFALEKHTDATRYYIRPLSGNINSKKLWNDFFRKIPISQYSHLRIDRNGTQYTFYLES